MNAREWLRSCLRVCVWTVPAVPLALVLTMTGATCALARTPTPVQSTSYPDSYGISESVSVSGSLDASFIGLAVPSQLSSAGSGQSDATIPVTVYSDGAWNLAVSGAESGQATTLAGNGTASVSVELVRFSAMVDSTGADRNRLVLCVVPGD